MTYSKTTLPQDLTFNFINDIHLSRSEVTQFYPRGGRAMQKLILICLAGILLLPAFGCGGGGDPINPGNPVELVGDWVGTYQNDVVGTGTIELTFFMDGTSLKVTYDLQGGEVTGTSNVGINGREITFIGVGTKLTQVKGIVSGSGREINGTLTIDYTLSGTRTGNLSLSKV
jgi:hypothetical protein